MLSSERNDEEWLSPFLPQEEKVANYPPQADATGDDSSNAAGFIKR